MDNPAPTLAQYLYDPYFNEGAKIVAQDPSLIYMLDNEGNNPLHLAIQQYNRKAITCLLKHYADPLQVNYTGKTPFAQAIEQNKDWTLLFEKVGIFFVPAGQENPFQIMRTLLKKAKNHKYACAYESNTIENKAENFIARLFASIEKRKNIPRKHLQKGIVATSQGYILCDLSFSDLEFFYTQESVGFIHNYLINRCKEVLDKIQDRENNYMLNPPSGLNALLYPMVCNWNRISNFVYDYPYTISYNKTLASKILFYALKHCMPYTIIWLLNSKPDLTVTDENGNTLLHAAIECKHKTVIERLLLFKIDFTLRNNNQETALDSAKKSEDYLRRALVENILVHFSNAKPSYLFKKQKRVEEFFKSTLLSDREKYTFLRKCATEKKHALCKILLENCHLSPNTTHDAGETILDILAQDKDMPYLKSLLKPIIILLLENGAIVTQKMIDNAQDENIKALLVLHQSSCCICFEPTHENIACRNPHPSTFLCQGCSKHIDTCPICRQKLD